MSEQRLGEMLAQLLLIPPQSVAAVTTTSAAIDMRYFRRALVELLCGAISADATIDMKIQGSVDGSTNWADIVGKAITQVPNTGDNKTQRIDIQAEDLKATGDSEPRRYARVVITTVGTASLIAATVLGDCSRYGPASDYNSNVNQTVI
jgi:hypothetical protein